MSVRGAGVQYATLVIMYAHDEVRGWDEEGPPDEVVDAASTLLRMLADPTRMRILWVLSVREYDVAALTEQVGGVRPAVSQHLAKLKLAGLVESRKSGRRSLYRVRGVHVRALLTEVFSAADHQTAGMPDHESSAARVGVARDVSARGAG